MRLARLEDELGDLDVVVGRAVEGRVDDLAVHRTLHVGDLLRPLVDQQHDEVRVRVSWRGSALAICFRSVVLPAFGGETIMPRWPLPMGATRSMIRWAISFGWSVTSIRMRSSG